MSVNGSSSVDWSQMQTQVNQDYDSDQIAEATALEMNMQSSESSSQYADQEYQQNYDDSNY